MTRKKSIKKRRKRKSININTIKNIRRNIKSIRNINIVIAGADLNQQLTIKNDQKVEKEVEISQMTKMIPQRTKKKQTKIQN